MYAIYFLIWHLHKKGLTQTLVLLGLILLAQVPLYVSSFVLTSIGDFHVFTCFFSSANSIASQKLCVSV